LSWFSLLGGDFQKIQNLLLRQIWDCFGQNKSHPGFGWLVCVVFFWLRASSQKLEAAARKRSKPLFIYALKQALPGHVFQYLFFSLDFVWNSGPQPSPSAEGERSELAA
jgi:hypothetical protein